MERMSWRLAVVVTILGLAIAPSVPFLVLASTEETGSNLWSRTFLASLGSSLSIGIGVTLMSFCIGFPLGLLSALHPFRGRAVLVGCQSLPLLLPSFLLAIGWSSLPGGAAPLLQGITGVTFVLGMQAVPLPLLTTFAACRNLTASQIDAARLYGGELAVLRLSARSCAPAARIAATLAGVLSLSDPGAALILGSRPAAVEILTSFSALFDFALAARQCLVLTAMVLAISAPILLRGLPSLAAAVLARQTERFVPPRSALGVVAAIGLMIVLGVGIGLPLLGLCRPALENPMLIRAAQEVRRTLWNTLIYAGGAGVVTLVLATALALLASEQHRFRLGIMGVLLGLFALPPALAGLGTVLVGTRGPVELDWLTRSRLTVVLILGLRFLPIATLVMLRMTGSLSPSWSEAARLHGVPTIRFLRTVTIPLLRPGLAAALVLVMVLATADVTTVLLLHPPGSMSLPLAVFTVMANSPEGLVASLCLMYVGIVLIVVTAVAIMTQLRGIER